MRPGADWAQFVSLSLSLYLVSESNESQVSLCLLRSPFYIRVNLFIGV